jgi:hypothetical protein
VLAYDGPAPYAKLLQQRLQRSVVQRGVDFTPGTITMNQIDKGKDLFCGVFLLSLMVKATQKFIQVMASEACGKDLLYFISSPTYQGSAISAHFCF